ncbi:hypothetical protein G647_09933 [Cladophialophora carrionii CBS 160.54]|uniref:Uncharacterized protein n=1 Tax=Cladophialophora carrionii CBS 160.54 TaxID=1279043 RepID=V9DK61_9EURO|nr:uncharacterized protein G647_09933 [Cladophialophora carrionii CBS 160.54]ETI27250.1 hypothetical protein G647_09933 [Cladophialophora carrionii CBS 160.54]
MYRGRQPRGSSMARCSFEHPTVSKCLWLWPRSNLWRHSSTS